MLKFPLSQTLNDCRWKNPYLAGFPLPEFPLSLVGAHHAVFAAVLESSGKLSC